MFGLSYFKMFLQPIAPFEIPNPNTIKSYKDSQKLSPKHAARGVVKLSYPIYRHGKACLSKLPPWHAAGDPCLACGRSRVRAPAHVSARTLFSPPSLPSHLPHQTHESVKANALYLAQMPLWQSLPISAALF